MTRAEKTAAAVMTLVVLISFTFGCFHAVAPRDSNPILIECGINPVNGAWLEGGTK